MKTIKLVAKYLIVIAAILLGFVSCAGLEGLQIVTHTPYGSGTYQDGVVTVTPTVPITIPIYGTK